MTTQTYTRTVTKKIAVIIHLYYQDLLGEFLALLNSLADEHFDVFFTLTDGSAHSDQMRWVVEQITKRHPTNSRVFRLANKGTDNGPLLHCLDYIFSNGLSYEFVLKLHTKKSLNSNTPADLAKVWRQELIRPIVGSPAAVQKCLKLFADDPTIGMIGAKRYISSHINTNLKLVQEYQKIFNFRKAGGMFIGGSMYWIRFQIFRQYLEDFSRTGRLQELYDQLENGYVVDDKNGTRTHALERIWGYAVTNAGFRIHGVKDNRP